MRDIFKLTVKIEKKEQVELLFDDQDRAERFINALTQILTPKGKKEIEFIRERAQVIDCDDDVIKAFSSVM
jgi:vacuolar-type H+-ATPase subunit D/Vma8